MMVNLMVKSKKGFIKNSLIKNSLILFTGQSFSSAIFLLISILTVRELGFEKYGVITLGLAYVNILNMLFNFQSFNAVIKFGHEAIAHNNKQQLKLYIKQALLQDVFTAILAFIISLLFFNSIVELFDWGNLVKTTIFILSFSILFNISGSIVGVLRLYEKFKYISTITMVTAIIKLLLVLVGMYFNFSFLYFVFIELISLILSNILNGFAGILVLKNNKLLDFLLVKGKWDKEFLKFNIYNNLVTTLDLPVGEFTKVFINQFIGTAELGLYNILVKVGNIIYRLTEPIAVVMYPELSKYIAHNNSTKAFALTKKVVYVSFAVGSLLILLQFITFPIWSEFIFEGNAHIFLVLIYFFYTVFCASVTSIHQIFIALNFVKYNIPIILIANVFYIIIAPLMMSRIGLMGLIVSLFIQALTVIMCKIIIINRRKYKFIGGFRTNNL